MKVFVYLASLFFLLPSALEAKYLFNETVFINLPKGQEGWILGYQNAQENGSCITRYVLESEIGKEWSKIVNIQFKDKEMIPATTALEAMAQEHILSPDAESRILTQHINDLIYERSFPSGEQELVRMIMTKKGLHRIAYIKKGMISSEERKEWISRLMSGVIGSNN